MFVEPVKEMASTSELLNSSSPTVLPGPVTRLITPGGIPALARASTNRYARSGVSDAGLNTTQLPETNAGAIFQAGMAIGKFQGVTTATTPIGSRRVWMKVLFWPEGIVFPSSTGAKPA